MHLRTIILLVVCFTGATNAAVTYMDWWGLEYFVKSVGINNGAKTLLQCWSLPVVQPACNKTVIEGMPLEKLFGETTLLMDKCKPSEIEFYIKDCIANNTLDAKLYKDSVKLLITGSNGDKDTEKKQTECRKEICAECMACEKLVRQTCELKQWQIWNILNPHNMNYQCNLIADALNILKNPINKSSGNCQQIVKDQGTKERAKNLQGFTDLINNPGIQNVLSSITGGGSGGASTGGLPSLPGLPTNGASTGGGFDFLSSLTSIFNGK